jgi:hypothetical protein
MWKEPSDQGRRVGIGGAKATVLILLGIIVVATAITAS